MTLRPTALLLLAALVAASVPTVTAGTEAAPELTDPAGDVELAGAPVPAALGWADLRRAWFEAADGNVTLTIDVDGTEPLQGEVGVTFTAADRHYIAGFTVVPGLYAGGFLSESDAAGDVPSSVDPQGMPGTWTGSRIRVVFPLEAVGTPAELGQPWAWSESEASNGETRRLDRSEVGMAFRIAPAPSGQAPPTQAVSEGPEEDAAAPPVPVALAAVLVAALALARVRRAE